MDAEVGPLFARYQQTPILDLTKDETALKVGERLYANYCTTCHGSDARGARGYPNLRDGRLAVGRHARGYQDHHHAGPPGCDARMGSGARRRTRCRRGCPVRSEPVGASHHFGTRSQGKAKYEMFCVACHGADGTGNTALGAPNLTDDIWLYGGSLTRISESIAIGRNGKMPAQGEFLGEAKVHLLAAYIYSLSQQQ